MACDESQALAQMEINFVPEVDFKGQCVRICRIFVSLSKGHNLAVYIFDRCIMQRIKTKFKVRYCTTNL